MLLFIFRFSWIWVDWRFSRYSTSWRPRILRSLRFDVYSSNLYALASSPLRCCLQALLYAFHRPSFPFLFFLLYTQIVCSFILFPLCLFSSSLFLRHSISFYHISSSSREFSFPFISSSFIPLQWVLLFLLVVHSLILFLFRMFFHFSCLLFYSSPVGRLSFPSCFPLLFTDVRLYLFSLLLPVSNLCLVITDGFTHVSVTIILFFFVNISHQMVCLFFMYKCSYFFVRWFDSLFHLSLSQIYLISLFLSRIYIFLDSHCGWKERKSSYERLRSHGS